MRKKTFNFLLFLAALALVIMLVVSATFAKEYPATTERDGIRSLHKPTDEPRYQVLNINNLWTWTSADGYSSHSPNGDNGTFFPRGTAWLIYLDGIMWGGKCYSDAALTTIAPYGQLIRVGGSNYEVGTREGHIIGMGATAVQSNPGDARVYRIRRDYASMDAEELKRDVAEYNETSVDQISQVDIDEVYGWYERDWAEWPVDLGAPFIDRNGNGVYDPPPAFGDNFTVDSLIAQGCDEPGVAGADPNSPADQVIWTVYNDLDRQQCLQLQGSEPMGIEVQVTVWGYKRTDALGNLFFRRVKLINKGGVAIDNAGTIGSFWVDSMYVAQWADPDLGVAGDDLLGCDTLLSIGYVYNGNPNDNEYVKFNLPPPAAGYDFLQGPMITGEAGDRAVFDLKYRDGFKNLGMTSFSWFSAGSAISDPPRDYTRGTLRWYKMLKGYAPVDGPLQFYPFAPGATPNKFPLSGDPVTGKGLLDGLGFEYSFAPGDRRLNCSTGPFILAPGDTQEVVVALVCGLGADRLSSVAVMKFNDRFAQNTYDALFQVPTAPKAPKVKVAGFNGKVILEWGSDLTNVKDIETKVNEPGGFTFEGYNVYQFPTRTASVADAKRIATFDLPDDPTVILDEQFDQASGQILSLPVQYGSNSGIQRYFEFDRDYVLDIDKIYNGQEYYLAVTAYSRATVEGFLPASLESAPVVLTVVPKIPFGTEYQAVYGDTLTVEHASGQSDGIITPIVIDPTAGTGDTYEIRFDTTGGTTSWQLWNVTDSKTILTEQTNQSGDANYDIIEGGIYLKVSGPPPGVKDYDWISGSRFLTWGGGAAGLEFEGFGGALGWASPRSVFGDGTIFIPADKLKNVEIRFANVDADGNFDPNQPNVSYGYRHGRGFGNAPAKPEFAPFIINTEGGYSYQDFTKSIPLAVYDIDVDPPRRLALAHLENNAANGLVDGKYWPPYYEDVDNTDGAGPREWLWIMDADYSETPNPEYQVEIIDGPQPVFLYATWARRNTDPWTDENVMQIIVNRPNTPDDVFRYVVPAGNVTADLQVASAKSVGVFPNPYYAFNPAERNRLARFVTFNNLPPQATVRIFNLAGQLVRKIDKNDNAQFLRWDLLNHDALPVASGMYIAHIEMIMPANNKKVTKVLKLAIIQEQEVLDVY